MFSSVFLVTLVHTAVTALKSCGIEQPTLQQVQDALALSTHPSFQTNGRAVDEGFDIKIYVLACPFHLRTHSIRTYNTTHPVAIT
jgi:hypothetical protein